MTGIGRYGTSRWKLGLAAALLTIVSVAGGTAGVAEASASGSTGFKSPLGILSGDINGSGLTVKSWDGVFTATTGTICNYRFRYQQYDINGRVKNSSYSPTVNKCHFGGGVSPISLNNGAGWNYGAGKGCVALLSNGSTKATVCFSIHK